MTSPLTTVYKCADGTEFPVEWNEPEQRDYRWSWDTNHWPTPLKPFDVAAWLLSEVSARSNSDSGTKFLAAFEEYLKYYGLRTSRWECALPTFREQPEAPRGFIKHAIMNDVPAPLEVQ